MAKKRAVKKSGPTKNVSLKTRAKKLFTSLTTRRKVEKDKLSRKQAEYLASLPKGKVKRLIWRMHPKRVAGYWFSRKGAMMALKLTGIAIALLGLFIFGLFAYYRKDLPTNIADLQACVQGQTTQYYDSSGETLLWSSKGNVDCTPVDIKSISPHLIDAVLAIEDKDFYEHGGFKSSSVLRAGINNLTGGDTQGGSTITQQYVKNAILKSTERVYSRKIKELILSIELERSFTKDEILNAYLNVASFGSVYDGIEAASRGYFGKPSSELTLDESALLAAAIPAPGLYWSEPELHKERQQYALQLMYEQGKINEEEYNAAKDVDTFAKVARDRNQYEGIIAPHFVLEVEKQLIEEFGEGVRKLGFKVITTIDLRAQEIAEQSVANALPAIERRGFDNGAEVAVDAETGKVIAHVGSRDFDYPEFGQTNTVTTPRDPGSAFKLFDYASLIENTNDWGAGSTVYDYKTTFAPGYTPKNYDSGHRGPIPIRYGLGQSLNIPAIKAMYIAGVEATHELAYQVGLRTRVVCGGGYCGLASAIGSGVELRLDELVNSYATFSRGGKYLPLTYIDKIYDADGSILREWTEQPEQVVDPQTAYILTDMLSDNSVRFAQSSYTTPGVTTAVKTGTTDNFKNNTVMGYSKTVAFGAWLGHHDITLDFGESNTTPIKSQMWRDFMVPYHEGLPAEETSGWDRPEGIQTIKIDRTSGYQSETGQADIYPSWYVPKKQDTKEETKIDTVSGKRATDCTPARAIGTVSGGNILAELPETDPYFDEWMAPIRSALGSVVGGQIPVDEDDLHSCSDVKPSISFSPTPSKCEEECTMSVTVSNGTHGLANVNFLLDGQILPGGSYTASASGKYSHTYKPDFSGNKTLVVEVVDTALYDAQVSATIEFVQRQAVNLDNPVVVPNFVNFSWSRKENNLLLKFGGACAGKGPVSLPSGSTSEAVNVSSYPSGSCTARIDYEGLFGNTVNFTLP